MKQPIIIPLVSEKSYAQSNKNSYVFRTPVSLNKNEIKQAVEEQFGVTVKGIKTLISNGKAIRYSRGKRRYPGSTTRQDFKKAYVTLIEGDSIKVFEKQEQAEEKK